MEWIRYFSFQFSFWHTEKSRTVFGQWAVICPDGRFPAGRDLIKDIGAYLKSVAEPDSICLHSWQEFSGEKDYRDFTGVSDIDFYEAGAQEREKMLQGK